MPKGTKRVDPRKDRAKRRLDDVAKYSPRYVRRHLPRKAGDGGVCGSPHPSKGFAFRGAFLPLLCERPGGHKVQHRAKTRAGYEWW